MTLFPSYYNVNPYKTVWINPEDVTFILDQGQTTIDGNSWTKFEVHFASGEKITLYCELNMLIKGLLGLEDFSKAHGWTSRACEIAPQ